MFSVQLHSFLQSSFPLFLHPLQQMTDIVHDLNAHIKAFFSYESNLKNKLLSRIMEDPTDNFKSICVCFVWIFKKYFKSIGVGQR